MIKKLAKLFGVLLAVTIMSAPLIGCNDDDDEPAIDDDDDNDDDNAVVTVEQSLLENLSGLGEVVSEAAPAASDDRGAPTMALPVTAINAVNGQPFKLNFLQIDDQGDIDSLIIKIAGVDDKYLKIALPSSAGITLGYGSLLASIASGAVYGNLEISLALVDSTGGVSEYVDLLLIVTDDEYAIDPMFDFSCLEGDNVGSLEYLYYQRRPAGSAPHNPGGTVLLEVTAVEAVPAGTSADELPAGSSVRITAAYDNQLSEMKVAAEMVGPSSSGRQSTCTLSNFTLPLGADTFSCTITNIGSISHLGDDFDPGIWFGLSAGTDLPFEYEAIDFANQPLIWTGTSNKENSVIADYTVHLTGSQFNLNNYQNYIAGDFWTILELSSNDKVGFLITESLDCENHEWSYTMHRGPGAAVNRATEYIREKAVFKYTWQ